VGDAEALGEPGEPEGDEPDGDELEGSGLFDGVAEDGPTSGTLSPPHATRTTSSTRNPLGRRMNAMLPAPARIPAMADWDLTPRRAADSAVTISQLMEVTDANVLGNVHGGVIMRLVDTTAALSAIRHSGGVCVTVSVDELSFLEPVHVGDVVTVKALVNDVGTTSLECGVRVTAENLVTATTVHASSAYLVFVAIDEDGKPRPVPPLVAESESELRRQREAKLRRQARMAHKAAVKAGRAADRS
jgi:acyl-CoA hydrolase